MVYREDVAPGLTIEMELRGILASTSSPYQKVDVIDTYFGKTLVTDGKTQSTQFDEFAYHESLVHPALLKFRSAAGHGPRTVFIGGGGELATAREVLRHPSVERCIMVDLDETVVHLCREHLPEWGGPKVASDPRLELVIGDAYAYLQTTDITFDVIIMDISDPIEAGPGIMLYTQEFYEHAATLLRPKCGVFVSQGGTAESIPIITTPSARASSDTADPNFDPSCFAPIANTLRQVFDVVIPYTVNIPSFGGDWGFVMATSSSSSNNGSDDQQSDHNDSNNNHNTNPVDAWCRPHCDAMIDNLIAAAIPAELRYYDGLTHIRMFALTKPLRRKIAQDDRIMTRENPVFMF